MLTLKDIKKSYRSGDFIQHALNGVSINFRRSEFVAILGASGSGKTTCLNIIGGLDRYDSGDLVINGRSTKNFRASDWDAYRNNSIGFIFQSYNLIGHISVLQNVEMGMTLSGVSSAKRRRKAMEVLERVGLADHVNKKPNQLSGGQMQRVAIARALANDPDIILADEPTGALDSTTSIQIMELIQEIAKDKLVIMVTHNPDIANRYSDRIIRFNDGMVVDDTNPYNGEDEASQSEYKLTKTSMSYSTSLGLSFRNILTKKGRTFLIALASSIGIIGIALILSLSYGFDIKINEFEQDTVMSFPIAVEQMTMDMDSVMDEMQSMANSSYPDDKEVYPYESRTESMIHINDLSGEYLDYLENNITGSDVSSMLFVRRALSLNFMGEVDGSPSMLQALSSAHSVFPRTISQDAESVVTQLYDVLEGRLPENMNEIMLVIDVRNRLDKSIVKALGLDPDSDTIDFSSFIGREIKWIPNDVYYIENNAGLFSINSDLQSAYNSEQAVTLKICGILRQNDSQSSSMVSLFQPGIAYTDDFVNYVLDNCKESAIVSAQKDSSVNVLTGAPYDAGDEYSTAFMQSIGGEDSISSIYLFPINFDAKSTVLEKLDKYNEGRESSDRVSYTDYAALFSQMSGSIMDAITIVLVAFASISLVVSGIMIGIITYIAVLERTKEIGVLRALGARKKDISRVFNSETFIIGLFSGLLGVGIAYLLTIPANMIIESLSDLPNVAQLNPIHAFLLIVISVMIAVIGGFLPALMAAKKDPVQALRTE